jgi:hypothetical protein
LVNESGNSIGNDFGGQRSLVAQVRPSAVAIFAVFPSQQKVEREAIIFKWTKERFNIADRD